MAFAPGEIEDGTGQDDAIVYEDVAAVTAWLTRRSKTCFSAKTAEEQEAILIQATLDVEAEFDLHFRGVRRRSTQGLVFPAAGARGIDGRLFHDHEIPKDYLVAIRLTCEKQSAGKFLTDTDLVNVKRFKGGPAEVEYQAGTRLNSLRTVHPDIWNHMRRALPGDP